MTVLSLSTALDYLTTGRFIIPTLTFIQRNIFLNLSSFYGATTPLYHITQSLPIMLFPIWYWWIKGFASCLLPSRALPSQLIHLDRPYSMKILSRGLAFAITILSFSPHSEWRFLHPFLPPLLLFALPPIFSSHVANVFGCYRFKDSIRQYTRFTKTAFYICLLAPVVPYLYLNIVHGRGQVAVMEQLGRAPDGVITGLVALMPCHSTPWMSHLHKDINAWFLTCEPPLEWVSLWIKLT
jgi:phosphatidylinositol glycan class B